jgi:DNA-binding response OmpR family regulator
MLLNQPAVKIVLLSENDTEPPLALLHAGVSGCIHRGFPQSALPGLLIYILNGGMTFRQDLVETALAEAWTSQKRQPLLMIGALRIDTARRLILYGGRHIRLTPREFALLTCLARNTDHVVTFDQLLNEAWGYDANDGTPAQVRLYVARLRRKLLDDAHLPDFILTERGIGYRLQSEVLHRTLVRPEPCSASKNGVHVAMEEPKLIYN